MDEINSFVTTLKGTLNQDKLLLTSTITIRDDVDFSNYNFSKFSESMEFINFIFDFQTSSMENYRMKDARDALDFTNFQKRIEKLITLNVSPTKMVIGVHFMGPAFILRSERGGQRIRFFKICGYNLICNKITTEAEKWEKYYIKSELLCFERKGTFETTHVIESSRSIANKVRYAMKRGLAGIVSIYIQADDHHGKYSIENNAFEDFTPAKGVFLNIPERIDPKFPLLQSVNEAIDLTLDEMDQESKLLTLVGERSSGSDSKENTEATVPSSDEATNASEEETEATEIPEEQTEFTEANEENLPANEKQKEVIDASKQPNATATLKEQTEKTNVQNTEEASDSDKQTEATEAIKPTEEIPPLSEEIDLNSEENTPKDTIMEVGDQILKELSSDIEEPDTEDTEVTKVPLGEQAIPKKVVCPMLTQSELDSYNLEFTLDKIDWNLCTHIISGDERGDGGINSLHLLVKKLCKNTICS